MDSPKSYNIVDGSLKLTTRQQSKDRVKIKTKKDGFGLGTYNWRIFVPLFELNDQCNIGAFLYQNSEYEYELDFEIGSGKNIHRTSLKAKPNEVIVYCTSQVKPHHSDMFLIEAGKWHDFTIKLKKGKKRCYVVEWYIDYNLVKSLQTQIKIRNTFSVHNSLENLEFVGDHLPKKENYVLFDHFKFE